MGNRRLREAQVRLQWRVRKTLRRLHLDAMTGAMGIIALLSGLFLFVWIVVSVSGFLRAFIPWVSGANAGNFFWASIFLALKFAALLLLFLASFALFFVLKFYNNKR